MNSRTRKTLAAVAVIAVSVALASISMAAHIVSALPGTYFHW